MIAWEDVTARDFLPGGRYFAGLQGDDASVPPSHADLARGIPYPDGTGRVWYPSPRHPNEPPPWSSRWLAQSGLSGIAQNPRR